MLLKLPKGSEFSWSDRGLITNHPGNQDQDDRVTAAELRKLFEPF